MMLKDLYTSIIMTVAQKIVHHYGSHYQRPEAPEQILFARLYSSVSSTLPTNPNVLKLLSILVSNPSASGLVWHQLPELTER